MRVRYVSERSKTKLDDETYKCSAVVARSSVMAAVNRQLPRTTVAEDIKHCGQLEEPTNSSCEGFAAEGNERRFANLDTYITAAQTVAP